MRTKTCARPEKSRAQSLALPAAAIANPRAREMAGLQPRRIPIQLQMIAFFLTRIDIG
jgi:hypothetical protein